MKARMINFFTGVEDSDSDLHSVQPGDFIAAKNIRTGYGATQNAISPAKGNLLFSYTLPAGTNTCVGSVEDKRGGSIIYFVKNSNGNHKILQYFPDNRVRELLSGSYLNFNNWIQAEVVDGKYLYWTDGRNGSGNPPRKLNIDKAHREKNHTYELHFDPTFVAGTVYTIETYNADGTVDVASTPLYTVPIAPSQSVVFAGIIAALVPYGITASALVDKIQLTHNTAGKRISITGVGVILVSVNHYRALTYDQITVVKPVPQCPPRPVFTVDATIRDNKVYGFSFQFRYRYVFDDGEKSKWSPVSYVPTNFVPFSGAVFTMDVENSKDYNKLRILFVDTRLLDQNWRGLIKSIDMAVRYSENDIWRYVDNYPLEAIGVSVPEVEFTNTGTYGAVPSDDIATADIQALANFDFVPLVANAIESVSDDNGESILVLSGLLEGYTLQTPKAIIEIEYDAPDVSPHPAEQATKFKSLKSGGTYRVGLVYEDEWGRQSPVLPLGEITVANGQVNDFLPHLKVTITSTPPSWARKYRICISKNQNQQFYVQLLSPFVRYWKSDPAVGDFTSTSFGAGDAEYIGLTVIANDLDASAFRNFIFEQQLGQQQVFLPVSGDRIQVQNFGYAAGANRPDIADIDLYNFEIAGYSTLYPAEGAELLEKRTFTIFIKPVDGIDFETGTNDWCFFEIYRPNRNVADNIYYEFSDCIDFTGSPPVHQAFYEMKNLGDAYNASKLFNHRGLSSRATTYVSHVQRPTLYPAITEIGNDLGRPVIRDPDYGEKYESDKIRFSDLYSIGGLSSFRGTNYKRINRSFGPIMSTKLIDSVLLVVCTLKSQPVYVGKEDVIDLSGNELLGRSSDLFNIANELVFDLGTQNPESICSDEGNVWGWDVFKGIPWKYTTSNGQRPINQKRVKHFIAKGRANFSSVPLTIGYFDREHRTYYLTFPDSTLGFKDQGEQSGWIGSYDFIPEAYGQIGNHFVSFKNGAIWRHEANNLTYYGIAYDPEITFVANEDPLSIKDFFAIEIEANKKWWAPLIVIPESGSYSEMRSELIVSKILPYEGRFKGDFLRDYNDPSNNFAFMVDPQIKKITALLRGRNLRGEVIVVTLRTNTQSLLRTAAIIYTKSQITP